MCILKCTKLTYMWERYLWRWYGDLILILSGIIPGVHDTIIYILYIISLLIYGLEIRVWVCVLHGWLYIYVFTQHSLYYRRRKDQPQLLVIVWVHYSQGFNNLS
jgi:hypothetical protein